MLSFVCIIFIRQCSSIKIQVISKMQTSWRTDWWRQLEAKSCRTLNNWCWQLDTTTRGLDLSQIVVLVASLDVTNSGLELSHVAATKRSHYERR
jgi:hypothetical protein